MTQTEEGLQGVKNKNTSHKSPPMAADDLQAAVADSKLPKKDTILSWYFQFSFYYHLQQR